jgi:type I restriction enzyme, R subunit
LATERSEARSLYQRPDGEWFLCKGQICDHASLVPIPERQRSHWDRVQLDDRGTLDRRGVELIGLRHPIALAQFKPAMAMNADIMARYAANRLRVVRQVRYSVANENCIDLVLFLNGIPVATTELKTDFTQSVADAIDQYRFNRNPRPKDLWARCEVFALPSYALSL